jgi:hypothetical protein
VLFYRAAVDLSRSTLNYVAGLIRRRHRAIGSTWGPVIAAPRQHLDVPSSQASRAAGRQALRINTRRIDRHHHERRETSQATSSAHRQESASQVALVACAGPVYRGCYCFAVVRVLLVALMRMVAASSADWRASSGRTLV